MNMRALLAVVCASLTSWPLLPAQALPDSVLRQVVPYDLSGPRTFEALDALGQIAHDGAAEERHDARFVRVLAYADLWLLASALHDDHLGAGVASALGRDQAGVAALLRDELGALDAADPALRDAALALAAGRELPTVAGPRTAALVLGRVVGALRAQAPQDPLTLLAQLVPEPCGQSCPAPLAALDADGRRAHAALARAGEALLRLRADAADPFTAALASFVADAGSALAAMRLFPGAPLPEASVADPHVAADHALPAFGGARRVILHVGVDGFSVRVTGELSLGPDLRPVIHGVDAPPVAVAVPADLAPFVKPLPALSEALAAAAQAAPGAPLLVSVAEGTAGHLVARALLSARAASLREPALVIATGPAVAVPIASVSALEAGTHNGTGGRVTLRRGGFGLKRGATSSSLPRTRSEHGFAFDYAGLQAALGSPKGPRPELAFAADVDGRALVSTAALLARPGAPLSLLLP
jgi:hypothetical protein